MQSVRQWSLQHYKMDPVNYCKHKILLTMHYSVISNVLNARNVFLALWFLREFSVGSSVTFSGTGLGAYGL